MTHLFSTHHILTGLLLSLCLSATMACTEKEYSDEERLQQEITGHWYLSEDNELHTVAFRKDGTGSTALHTYNGKQWTEKTSPVQYTLSGHTLTVLPDGGNLWTGTVGVVGNSLSLTDAEETYMLKRFDGTQGTIEQLKQNIENSWEEILPMDTVIDSFAHITEQEAEMIINSIYVQLRNYEYRELLLEKIRLTHTYFDGHPAAAITPTLKQVADAWQTGWGTINTANLLLQALEGSDIDEEKRNIFRQEAEVLRSFVYLSLAQLWGKAPYITRYNPQHPEEQLQSPILTAKQIYQELDLTLQGIELQPERDYRLTTEAVKALRGELALELGNKAEAEMLLDGCQPDFSLYVNEYDAPEIFRIFGNTIPNYTAEKAELLLREARQPDTAGTAELAEEWERKALRWGYWPMLKRTGLAQSVCGCATHELLMPIPQEELELIPGLEQNPGY